MKLLFQLVAIVFFLPNVLSGQEVKDVDFKSFPDGDRKLLHVSESDNGDQAFFLFYAKAIVDKADGTRQKNVPVKLLYQYFIDGDEVSTVKTELLDHGSFPEEGDYTVSYFHNGKRFKTESSSVLTTDKLARQYPQLHKVDRSELFEQESSGQEIYISRIKKHWSNRIEGFNSLHYKKGEKDKVKKSSKLISLSLAAAAPKFRGFGLTEEVKLDWKESYGGGQDKNNHWKNYVTANCYSTGNLLAINGKKIDKVRGNEEREFEVVLYDNKGEVLSKKELVNETYWTAQKSGVFYDNSNKIGVLESLSLTSKPNTGKKINKGGNKAQFKLTNVNKSGEVVYDHIYDLKDKFRIIDTVIVLENNKTLVRGYAKKQDFLAISTPDGQELIDIPSSIKNSLGSTEKIIIHKGITYLIAKAFPSSKSVGYTFQPIKNSQLIERFDIKYLHREKDTRPLMEQKTPLGKFTTDFIIVDDRFFVITKELADVGTGKKRVIPNVYEVTENGAEPLMLYSDYYKVLADKSFDDEEELYIFNDKLYMLTQNFEEDSRKKGSYKSLTKLTSIEI